MVIDYFQPDGEIASADVDPPFGNNTTVPRGSGKKIALSDAGDLLADPDLDVVGQPHEPTTVRP